MLPNIFITSDQHLNHSNILTFLKNDGSKLRDFPSVEEMNETIIERYNSVVKPNDKVYNLGDVCFNLKALDLFMSKFNGTKILIKGNHDTLKAAQYLKYFKDIRAYSQVDKFMLSHIPFHTQSVGRWKMNVHGHLHSNNVLQDDTTHDSRYFCACVEQHNFYPVALEDIIKIAKDRGIYDNTI